jgi:hypothetical protein
MNYFYISIEYENMLAMLVVYIQRHPFHMELSSVYYCYTDFNILLVLSAIFQNNNYI